MASSHGSSAHHRLVNCLAAATALGLLAVACASDSPAPPELQLSAEFYANRSAARCTNVEGTLVGTVLGVSELTGDLTGQVWAYQAPVALLRGQAIHLNTFHHFELGNGDWFQTEDSGVQAPVRRRSIGSTTATRSCAAAAPTRTRAASSRCMARWCSTSPSSTPITA